MVYAAIVAGGTGSRMGADIPKQFLLVSGKPVIIHTISQFVGRVDKIVVACHKDYVEHTKNLAEKYGFDVDVIPGGTDRMSSVEAVIDYLLENGASDEDVILTHDGVRPFVTENMINQSIENARKGHFCTIAVSSTDTVCISTNGKKIDSVPARKEMFSIQTPQTFLLGNLKEMLEKCPDAGKFTDLCGLALAMGYNAYIVEGSPENIKITVPADLAVAEAILEKRNHENR